MTKYYAGTVDALRGHTFLPGVQMPNMKRAAILTAILSAAFLISCGPRSWGDFAAPRLKGPERSAWNAFASGIRWLAVDGDRLAAAIAFRQASQDYPNSRYAGQCRELADLLDRMVEEDRQWAEPEDPSSLPLEERIHYNIHHLRNVRRIQRSQPGKCDVLHPAPWDGGRCNAAVELRRIGDAAIPALMDLLGDRRPIMAVAMWRRRAPWRLVLRYQDAAIQILDELLAADPSSPNADVRYLSPYSTAGRKEIIESLKSRYDLLRGKSMAERKWLAVREATHTHTALSLLESLASEHGERDRVLRVLREMGERGRVVPLPQASYLMCQLGDQSKLEDVAGALLQGKYRVQYFPEAPHALGGAQEIAALKQAILYGDDVLHQKLAGLLCGPEDPRDTGSRILGVLVLLASNRGSSLPRGYGRARFPTHLLIAALDRVHKQYHGVTSSLTPAVRECDAAAWAIQQITGRDFGFEYGRGIAARNRAIKRIRQWWLMQNG
jgi:hypothetical protein